MNILVRSIARLHWTLGAKFSLAIGAIVLFSTVLYMSLAYNETNTANFNLNHARHLQATLACANIQEITARQEAQLLRKTPPSDLTTTSDPLDPKQFNTELANLRTNTTASEASAINDIARTYQEFNTNAKEVSTLKSSDSSALDVARTKLAQSNDKLQQQLIQLKNNQTTLSDTELGQQKAAVDFQRIAIIIGQLTMLILALLIIFILREIVRRPVDTITQQLNSIAKGNLQTEVSVANGDEIGTLANEVNNTVNNLRRAIEKLKNESSIVENVAVEIDVISSIQARGSKEQVNALGQLSSTIEEMSQTAHTIADGARVVVDVAQHALEVAEHGSMAIQNTLGKIEQLRSEVHNITERILGVNTQAQQVTTVVDIISSIAHSTHLLALNASIEAAGAGEQGARFSVVAAEVKKLAHRAQLEAQTVRMLVEQVQLATGTAVMATEQGMKEAEHLSDLSGQAGSALEEIIDVLTETTHQAQAIALATQQQQTGSEQMLASVKRIGQVSLDSSQAALEIAATAQQLNRASIELREAVLAFEQE